MSDLCIQVQIVVPSEEEARKISHYLIQEKLAACAQFFPIVGIYRWRETLDEQEEVLLYIKTTKANFEEVENYIKKVHVYETPEIIAVPLKHITDEYKKWIVETVK